MTMPPIGVEIGIESLLLDATHHLQSADISIVDHSRK